MAPHVQKIKLVWYFVMGLGKKSNCVCLSAKVSTQEGPKQCHEGNDRVWQASRHGCRDRTTCLWDCCSPGFGGLNSGYQAHRQALDLLSDHTGPVTKTLTHTTPCPSTQESCKKVAFGTNWNKLEMDQMCGSRQTLKVKTEHLRLFEPLWWLLRKYYGQWLLTLPGGGGQ